MFLRAYTRAKVGWGDFRVRIHEHLVDRLESERGAVAAEYALLVALIAVVITIGAFALGGAINGKLSDTAGCVSGAPGPC